MDSLIYDRQKELELKDIKSVCVIGLGGVGSWVALNLALTGTVKKIVLIDADKIEEHNLNRTLFKISDIGDYKVFAVERLILERRQDIETICINKFFENLNDFEKNIVNSCKVIVNCADRKIKFTKTQEKKAGLITAGYDGFNVTIHINKHLNTIEIWNDDEQIRYRITPSWLIPPQFLANVITLYLCCDDVKIDDEIVKTFNIKKVIEWIKE